MNPSTLLGILLGLTSVAVALFFASADASHLINLPGLAIVITGTAAAAFIAYPLREIGRAMLAAGKVFRNERMHLEDDVEEIIRVSRLWYKGELQDTGKILVHIKNPFLRTGVQLVLDGESFANILELLTWRLNRLKARERNEAGVFRDLAGFAPAFGMVGTVIGLITMLVQLGNQDFTQMAMAMAVALLTTLYGMLLAHLVFKPIAIKLERRTEARMVMMGMIIEGIRLISERRQPSLVKATLYSFLVQHQDELHDTGSDLTDDEIYTRQLHLNGGKKPSGRSREPARGKP
jgi:chemotaxis protein MotA